MKTSIICKLLFYGLLTMIFASCTNHPNKSDIGNHEDAKYLKAELREKKINLDPAGIWEFETIEIFNIIFDSLYLIDEQGKIQPSLAKSFPSISTDGLTYTIHLKQNVLFHEDPCFGTAKTREFVANDIVYTLKRIADPKNESGLWSILQGKIVGLDAFRTSLANKNGKWDAPVSGLNIITPHELQITLTQPQVNLLYLFTMPSLSIVPHEAVEKYKKNFAFHPVGTGPYALVSYQPQKVIVKQVASHWRFSPKISAPKGIIFSYYNDSWNAFKNGELDIHYIDSKHIGAYVDRRFHLKEDIQKQGYKLYSLFSPDSLFLIFNHRKSYLQNPHLRKAILCAVDWKTLIDPEDFLSASVIPRGIPGYIPLQVTCNKDQAKSELSLAGFPQGQGLPELTLRFRYQQRLREAGMVQDDLEKIGLKIKLELKDQQELADADLGFQGWVLDYPDAASILALFVANNQPPDGNNYGYYQDSQYDDLFSQALAADGPAKTTLYEKMSYYLFKQVAIVPFRQIIDYYAISPTITHVEFDMLNYIRWTHLQLGQSPPVVNGESKQ